MDAMGYLVVVILVLVAVVVYLAYRSGSASRRSQRAPIDPLRKDSGGIDPRRIKVGDIVGHDGHDFMVRGTITLDQDGFVWWEHHLDDVSIRRWLSVEDDEELELCLWEGVLAPELAPGAASLNHGGAAYALAEQGRAHYTSAGATGTAPTGEMEFYDYAAGDRRLSFERYGGETWEVSVGTVVNERSLDIYPSAAA